MHFCQNVSFGLYLLGVRDYLIPMLNQCPLCGTRNRIPAERLQQRAVCGHCKVQLSPPQHPVAVTSTPDFEELIAKSTLPILVDFWAPWCAPCRLVAPEMQKVAEQRFGKILVAKVNADEVPDVAQRYGIDGLPTFVVFDAGKEVRRTSGAQAASGLLRELQL